MLAMTATCPPEEREDLLDALQMQDAICVERSLYRSNLVFLKSGRSPGGSKTGAAAVSEEIWIQKNSGVLYHRSLRQSGG